MHRSVVAASGAQPNRTSAVGARPIFLLFGSEQAVAMSDIVNLFRRLTLGVYVIGVTDGRTRDAFTASSVSHVSYQPLMLSVAVNPEHASYPLLMAGRTWTASVLDDMQLDLAARFGILSLAGSDKMRNISWGCGRLGAPYLSAALAYFDCRLAAEFPAGDHKIIVGRVIGGHILNSHARPLQYVDTGDLDKSSLLYPAHFD
jgi:flavin reductase (DIM6/NTAB) family NADH-FMN oxidoreductase RutF